jgi:hypothetical protein
MAQCEGTTKTGAQCSKSTMHAAAWEKWEHKIVAGSEYKGRLCFGCAIGGWETMAVRGGRGAQSAKRKKKVSGVADVWGYDCARSRRACAHGNNRRAGHRAGYPGPGRALVCVAGRLARAGGLRR